MSSLPTRSAAAARIVKLRELINDYRYQYHVLDNSIMSEAAADSLKHELAQLESTYPELITPDSPTQRVAGVALEQFQKVKHHERMISLADVFNASEITDWVERSRKLLPPTASYDFFVDIKMDGLACALHYDNGVFIQAVTRGDGTVGEDVTHNVRTIQNLPLRLPLDQLAAEFGLEPAVLATLEVRGEIVILSEDFARLNRDRISNAQKPFANPRNLAAGSIRQLNPEVAAARPLHFIAYDLVSPTLATFSLTYQFLRAAGFATSGQDQVVATQFDLPDVLDRLSRLRPTLPFNTDGAVIKINRRDYYSQLGIVGKTPRAAVAYKFPAEEGTTILKDIVISIGRTGAATPVAILEPLQLAGSTVRHASLHNSDEIARLDLHLGDTVIVYKAGDIIPQIKTVLTALRPADSVPFDYLAALAAQYPDLTFELPDGEVVYRVADHGDDFTLKRAIEYYASKPCMNIIGLGAQNVDALISSGLVKSLPDLYRLQFNDLVNLDRFAAVSARNLLAAIEQSKHVPLERFLTALGIRYVGTKTAERLVAAFGSLDRIISATEEELLTVPDVGSVVAASIAAYFADDDRLAELDALRTLGVSPFVVDRAFAPLAGKSYVITGTLESMDRAAAEAKLKSLGADITSSVTRRTTALIAGANPGASKLTKASSLSLPTISESDFLALINP